MNRHVARAVHMQDDTYGMHMSMPRVSVVTNPARGAPAVGESTRKKPRHHLDRHLHVSGFRGKKKSKHGLKTPEICHTKADLFNAGLF